ncbi:MAG: hypothetical protein ACJ749_17290 [Flavisolibacter sp.]
MRTLLIALCFLVCSGSVRGQDTSSRYIRFVRSTDLLVGVHWQGDGRESAQNEKKYRFVEIGFGKGKYNFSICGGGAQTVYVSEEMYFGRDKNIFGTKVGAWMHYLLDIGLSLIYYTDFKRGNFKIRPEFGVGLGRMRAVVGYNIPTIDNKAFTELTHHNMQAGIQFTLGIKQKEINRGKSI